MVVFVAVGSGTAAADTRTDPDPQTGEPASDTERFRAKKDRTLDEKAAAARTATANDKQAWERKLDRRIGKQPDRIINIYNTWTHEYVVVDFKSKAGLEQKEATVNGFLRCHFTDEPAEMDKRLFKVLVDAANHFGSQRIDIISGFRAPKYNLMLRKKGRGVARNSQHPLGNAVDFRVQGVATSRLRAWAQSLRLGGVGYYPSSGFVHVDVGRVRTWTGQ